MEIKRTDVPALRRPSDDKARRRPQNPLVPSVRAARLASLTEDDADE
ncbi:MAG: hypothetical protein O9320_16020 [Magnetospirillum sp.]|nr:hypothetical protein [Magnetospirillum sp.]